MRIALDAVLLYELLQTIAKITTEPDSRRVTLHVPRDTNRAVLVTGELNGVERPGSS